MNKHKVWFIGNGKVIVDTGYGLVKMSKWLYFETFCMINWY